MLIQLLVAMGCCAMFCDSNAFNDECSPTYESSFSLISFGSYSSQFGDDLINDGCPKDAYCNTDTRPFKCLCKKGFHGDGGHNCTQQCSSSSESGTSVSFEDEGCPRDSFCNLDLGLCVCKHGFQGDGLNCTPIATCRLPTSIPFGNWSRLGEVRLNHAFYPGDRITYTCEHGYTFKRNKSKTIKQCMYNGKWNPKRTPECLAIPTCRLPTSIPFGNWSRLGEVRLNHAFYPGDRITYTCEHGYTFKSNKSGTIKQCMYNGKWKPKRSPQCLAIRCTDIGYPENSNRTGKPPFFVGDEVRFRCASGYTLVGSELRTCQENGTWSGNLVVCDINVQCSPSLESSVSMVDSYDDCPKNAFCNRGTNKCVCRNGFQGDGRICKRQCSSSSESGTSVSFSSSVFEEDDSQEEGCPRDSYCHMETGLCVCKVGFHGDGRNCTPESVCEWPRSVAFGNRSRLDEIRPNNTFYPGDRIIYTCKHGYFLKLNKGKKIRQCMSNGKWDPEFTPECVVAKCDAPEANITNGSSTAVHGIKYQRGKVISYECFPGYRIKGLPWQSCISSDSLIGHWSNHPPLCEAIQCPDVGHPENSIRVGRPPFFVGDKVSFRCGSGYTLMGSELRTCQENGKWSGQLTICDSNDGDCPNPGVPINGHKKGRSYHFGDVVKFDCGSGFVIVGSEERRCLGTREWSGRQPICRGVGDYDDVKDVAYSFGKTLDKFVDKTTENHDISEGRPLDYGERLEIYIAIDSSGSIGEHNFNIAINFAKAVVRRTGVMNSKKGPRYGAVAYTDEVFKNFNITQHNDKNGVLKEFNGFTYPPVGGTSTTEALKGIREKMIPLSESSFKDAYSSPSEPPKRVVIIVTDGASNTGGDPVDVANKLKSENVEIYVIGAGVSERNREMIGMASTELGEDHVFILKDYKDFEKLIDLLKQKIDYSICGVSKGLGQVSNDQGENTVGTKADDGEWPWQVAIWESERIGNKIMRGSFLCSGSILSDRWILTAAHCFREREVFNKTEGQNEEITVGLGYTHRNKNYLYSKEMRVMIYIHPNYSNFDYDVALLRLERPVKFNNYIQPICLPKDSVILSTGDTVVTTGWGEIRNRSIIKNYKESASPPTYDLQEVHLKVDDWNECARQINKTQYDYYINNNYIDKYKVVPLTENMFCVKSEEHQSICYGDSGGPVVKRIPASEEKDEHWVQVGIVSFGFGCDLNGQNDVMSYIPNFLDWIQNVTSDSSDKKKKSETIGKLSPN